MSKKDETGAGCHDNTQQPCCEFPEFKRLNYFHGQLLGSNDFRTEQAYFREKQKLHNRCLHGYGTVCGLMVKPKPQPEQCKPAWLEEYKRIAAERDKLIAQKEALIKEHQQGYETEAAALQKRIEALEVKLKDYPVCELPPAQPTLIEIECGLALDCEGNELIVRKPLVVDLWHCLGAEDRKKVQVSEFGQSLWISLCYCDLPVEPMRPVKQDHCGVTPDCVSSKILDTVRVKVSLTPPKPDQSCETCCTCCDDSCLLLARIDGFYPGKSLKASQIHNGVRRLLSTYPYTTITGIGWKHGGTYEEDEATRLLGTNHSSKGLEVRFSRPVLQSTLTRGIVDLWVVEGGKTLAGGIYSMEAKIEYSDPHCYTTDHFYIRYTGDECPDPGDRVIIIIRAAFILDECCRPVDGAHVGGRVPTLPDCPHKTTAEKDEKTCHDPCERQPPGYGPWTSGTGHPGANFESWFYIAHRHVAKHPVEEKKS